MFLIQAVCVVCGNAIESPEDGIVRYNTRKLPHIMPEHLIMHAAPQCSGAKMPYRMGIWKIMPLEKLIETFPAEAEVEYRAVDRPVPQQPAPGKFLKAAQLHWPTVQIMGDGPYPVVSTCWTKWRMHLCQTSQSAWAMKSRWDAEGCGPECKQETLPHAHCVWKPVRAA